jgi:hypothetical protein
MLLSLQTKIAIATANLPVHESQPSKPRLDAQREINFDLSPEMAMQVLFHSLENSLLNLHSVLGDSKVYACDCDFVPKLAKGSRQQLSAFLLGFGDQVQRPAR